MNQYWYFNNKSEEYKFFLAVSYDQSYEELEKFCAITASDEDDWLYIGTSEQLKEIVPHLQ